MPAYDSVYLCIQGQGSAILTGFSRGPDISNNSKWSAAEHLGSTYGSKWGPDNAQHGASFASLRIRTAVPSGSGGALQSPSKLHSQSLFSPGGRQPSSPGAHSPLISGNQYRKVSMDLAQCVQAAASGHQNC